MLFFGTAFVTLATSAYGQHIAFIEISGLPDGEARIFVDSSEWPEPLGTEPVLLELVVPEHPVSQSLKTSPTATTIRVEREGYRAFVEEVWLTVDEVHIVRPRLEPIMTSLRLVHLLPAEAAFVVENTSDRGQTPATLSLMLGREYIVVIHGERLCLRPVDPDGAYVRIRSGSLDELRGTEVCRVAEASSDLDASIALLRRDFGDYYNNVIRQIFRCFRWSDGGQWEAEVFFYIGRGGIAEDIELQKRSGNAGFDAEAMGAVECAGNGRFGPLPNDLPYNRFPVKFSFRPQG